MNKRLLCLGLLAAVTQLFSTGCCHAVARWRANHPCGVCSHSHPLLHPFQTRRAAISEAGGTAVGPTMANSPCHGCNGHGVTPGAPVTFNGAPGDLMPVTAPPGYPAIGYPKPIIPGPTVVPSYELPAPMPVPKNGGN